MQLGFTLSTYQTLPYKIFHLKKITSYIYSDIDSPGYCEPVNISSSQIELCVDGYYSKLSDTLTTRHV